MVHCRGRCGLRFLNGTESEEREERGIKKCQLQGEGFDSGTNMTQGSSPPQPE